MVAPSAPPSPSTQAEQTSAGSFPQQAPIRSRSAMQRLIVSLTRLASIQTQLAILHTKLAAQRILMFAALMAVGAGIALAGLVFLYIGCFKLLCLAMPDYWAFLIFAGLHGLGAAVLFQWARALLRPSPPAASPAPSDTPAPELPLQEATI